MLKDITGPQAEPQVIHWMTVATISWITRCGRCGHILGVGHLTPLLGYHADFYPWHYDPDNLDAATPLCGRWR